MSTIIAHTKPVVYHISILCKCETELFIPDKIQSKPDDDFLCTRCGTKWKYNRDHGVSPRDGQESKQ